MRVTHFFCTHSDVDAEYFSSALKGLAALNKGESLNWEWRKNWKGGG